MPFVKVKRKGVIHYRGPSGRVFNKKQVRRYYARSGSFDAKSTDCNCGQSHNAGFFCDARETTTSDPTGTLSIRRALARELESRWRKLKVYVNKIVRDDDSFALSSASVLAAQVISTEGGRLKAFQTWLDATLNMMILGGDHGAWLSSPIARGYELGVKRANRLTGTKDWDPSQPREPKGSPDGGRWTKGYHGSPTAGIKELEGEFAYLTQDPNVAAQYAKNELVGAQKGAQKRKPTVYEIEAETGELFDLRKAAHRVIYEQVRQEFNARHDDPDEKLPSLKSQGFIQNGLPGFGNATTILRELETRGFHGMRVWEGSQGESIVVRDPKKRTRITRHYTPDAWDRKGGHKISDSVFIDSTDRITLLTNTAVIELQGIMEAVSQQAVRAMSAAILSNSLPREAANIINKVIDDVGVLRSKALASVSVVQAHATGTLDTFQSNGVSRDGIEPERHEIDGLTTDAWDPSKHPRHPAGSSEGGEFAPFGTQRDPISGRDVPLFEAEEAKRWGEHHFADWVRSLTDEERAVATDYAEGNTFAKLNNSLRNGIVSKTAKKLDAAIEKATLPVDLLLFRGVPAEVFGQTSLIGKTITDKAFVSTAMNEDSLELFGTGELDRMIIMRISAPKGSTGAYISGLAPDTEEAFGVPGGANEVLLPRGSKFYVVNDTRQGRVRTLNLNLQPRKKK